MARIRSVWPGICQSEDMATLPATLERTYVRLWTHCDDEGRAVDNPRLIKAAIYPLLDEQTWQVIDAELAQLEGRGFIARYEVEGLRYLSVLSWGKYQKPQKKLDSKFPPLPDDYAKPTVALPEASSNGKGLDLGFRKKDLGNRNTEVVLRASPEKGYVWEGFSQLFGEPTNKSAEKHRWQQINTVCESLSKEWDRKAADVGRSPEAKQEVIARANRWPLHFPNATLTERAVAQHWDQLGRPVMRATKQQVKRIESEVEAAARAEELRRME